MESVWLWEQRAIDYIYKFPGLDSSGLFGQWSFFGFLSHALIKCFYFSEEGAVTTFRVIEFVLVDGEVI